jgi:tetratricopeptide (TPR) repeat protein
LKATLQRETGNVFVRQALAECYESFEAYDQAAKILLDGAEEVALESKPRLLQQAAKSLAKDGQHDRALRILGDLLQSLPDPEERHSLFLGLAEVAHLKGDQILEAAALEQVLELNPSDAEVRFRVAYLYSEMKKDRLAVYHYRLRISQDQDPLAINNLGAAFDALKLKGKEIEMYEAASDRHELAKANLSHAYVDRGFLKSAEELALDVERSTIDDSVRQRATGALRRIADVRREEEKTEKAIVAAVKTERAFLARYATAFATPVGKPVVGAFNTPHGQLSFEHGADGIVGQGSFREEVPPSPFFGLLAGLGPGPFVQQKPTVRVRHVRFDGQMFGLAGRFKIQISEQEEGTLYSSPKSSSLEGLFIVSPEGDRLEVLEEKDNETKTYWLEKIAR